MALNKDGRKGLELVEDPVFGFCRHKMDQYGGQGAPPFFHSPTDCVPKAFNICELFVKIKNI